MKVKISSFVSFMSILFSPLIFAQYPQMDFPLQIGNVWQFGEDSMFYSESRTVKDTIMPNGLTYTQIIGNLYNGFFRKEGTKIFSYNTVNDTEYVKYDFSLKVGDTSCVLIRWSDTTLITVFSVGTKNILGAERNYMTFFSDDLSGTRDGYEEVADGIGFVVYLGEPGIYYTVIGAVINGIKYGIITNVENTNSDIPKDFRLLQNYPNPFNPTTTIAFEITKPGYVKLIIYDFLGRNVTTLLDRFENSGAKKVIFDGKNLSSGVYFYTINYNGSIKSKSMLLLK